MVNFVFQLVEFLDESVDDAICGCRWLPRTVSLEVWNFSGLFPVAFVVEVVVCLDFSGQIVNHFCSVGGFRKAGWDKGETSVENVSGGVVEYL